MLTIEYNTVLKIFFQYLIMRTPTFREENFKITPNYLKNVFLYYYQIFLSCMKECMTGWEVCKFIEVTRELGIELRKFILPKSQFLVIT